MLFSQHGAVASATLTSSILARSTRPVILDAACARLRTTQPPSTISVRHASHGTAGRANGPKNGAGKRLGAKKTGDEYVIPGNIIFRQRGTHWHAGENVGIGRDHTIFSLHHGYVKYYRNPRLDPKKRYIGVVFDKTQTLPTPMNAARRRRLGMVAVARQGVDVDFEGAEADGGVFSHARGAERAADEAEAEVEAGADADADAALKPVAVTQTPSSSLPTKRVSRDLKRRALTGRLAPSTLAMTAGNHYNFRESNYQIGRVAERAGVQYKEFEKGDRFLAWRKKGARKARNAERRSLGSKKGSKREGKGRA